MLKLNFQLKRVHGILHFENTNLNNSIEEHGMLENLELV